MQIVPAGLLVMCDQVMVSWFSHVTFVALFKDLTACQIVYMYQQASHYIGYIG